MLRIFGSRTCRMAAISLPLLFLAGLRPGIAQTGWAPTATQGVGTMLVNATNLGQLPSTTPLRIAVALGIQNKSALQQLVQNENSPSSSLYGTTITPTQFVSTYAPSSAQVQAVVSYLSSQGFTDVQAEPNNLFVTGNATAAQASAAFDTSINQFSQNGLTVYANMTTAQVPASLKGVAIAVLGLNNASRMHIVPQSQICVAGATCAGGLPICAPGSPAGSPCVGQFFTPQGFQQAYDVRTTPTGSATNIAIIAEGDLSSVITDLRYAESQNNLPQVPVTIVQVGLASPDTSGVDEWDLDSQMSTGMAQTVKNLYFYDTTSLTDSDLALAFNRFAAQDVAKAGSASLGECELFPYVDGSMLADDQTFLEAAAQGQTMFASSGDTGASCAVAGTNGVPDSGPPMVNYPASSPYVVAVGGTDLFVNSDGSYNRETAWEAGGGGISQFEYSPYWQAVAVPSNTAGDKGVPDIAMDAGLETGALVYINKTENIIGGTSVSSPLSLGVWARLESARNNRLGFASPNLYSLATGVLQAVPGFHDITAGCNGAYCATPGWDFTTGLGTFDVWDMNQLLLPTPGGGK